VEQVTVNIEGRTWPMIKESAIGKAFTWKSCWMRSNITKQNGDNLAETGALK
jgi:hypothetical protein